MALRHPTRQGRFGLWLTLSRWPMALPAVSNAWVMVFLAYGPDAQGRNAALEGLPMLAALGLAAVVSIGLHVSAVAFNDALDVRRDRLLSPDRPLTTGRMSRQDAAVVGMLGMLAAALASLRFGPVSTALCLLAGGGAMVFNLSARFVPAVGILLLATVRAVNMLVPNPQAGMLWPIVLAFTHLVLSLPLVYRLTQKRPVISPRALGLIVGGWLFVTLTLVKLMSERVGMAGETLPLRALPLVALLAWGMVAGWLTRMRGSPRRRGQRLAAAMMLWLMVYDACWLIVTMQAKAIPLLLLPAALGAGVYVCWPPSAPPLRYRIR